MTRLWTIALTALALATAMGLLASSASAESYEQVRSWQAVPADGNLEPTSIALDAQSNVYVGSRDGFEERVSKFSSEGRAITAWGGEAGQGEGQFLGMSAVEVDRGGSVFVADSERIQVFTPGGAFISGMALPPADTGFPLNPYDIDFDSQNRAFVTHAGKGGTPPGTLVYSPAGALIDQWGAAGAADGQLMTPSSVATDPQGNLWIADPDIPRIQRFSPSGAFLSAFGQAGFDPGQLNQPTGIDVDAEGNVYVLSTGRGASSRVDKFSPDGSLITSFGGDLLEEPVDIEVDDSNGEVYVADSYCCSDASVYVFRPTSGGGNPPGGPDPGGNRVKIASKSLNYKKNKIKVKIKCLGSGQCKGKAQIKKGKKTKLAKGSYKLPAGKKKNFTAKPTKQGKKQLKRTKKKLKVTVELKPTGGGNKVTKKLKLKG